MGSQSLVSEDLGVERSTSQPALVVLSAQYQASLEESIQEHSKLIKSNSTQIGEIAYTLCNQRERLPVKSFAVILDSENFEFSPLLDQKEAPDITMIFTGQGTQWVGMAKELIERYSSFDSDIQSLGAILLGLEDPPPWNLKEELLKPVKSSNLDLPEYGQPLLAAIQIALVNLLASLGVVPDAVIGFSSGEMAAAYASCAITAKEAIIAAYYRGQVVKKLDRKRGGMAAIGLGHNQVLPFLKPGVTVGCDPSPNFVVLSGDKDVLEIVCEDIRKVNIGVFNYRLPSSVAYHSHHMLEIGKTYETLLTPHIHSKSSTIPFYSSVTAELISTPGSLDASYWRDNLEKPVLFNAAIERSIKDHTGSRLFVEISANGNMKFLIRDFIRARDNAPDFYIPAMSRGKNCDEQLLELIGELFIRNIPINFDILAPKPQ